MKPQAWARCIPRYVTTYALGALLLVALVILLIPGSTTFDANRYVLDCEHGWPITYLVRSHDLMTTLPEGPANDAYFSWDLRSDITQFRAGMLILDLTILGALFAGLVALAEHGRRRWWPQPLRFGTRSLVAATILCSIGWWYGHGLNTHRRRIAAMQEVGGMTFNERGPSWLREVLGIHREWLLDTPVAITVVDGRDTPSPDWEELPTFAGVELDLIFMKRTSEHEYAEIPEEAMMWIAQTRTRRLYIDGGRLPASGLSALGGAPLERIHLRGNIRLSGSDLELLVSLPQLKEFHCGGKMKMPEDQRMRLEAALGDRFHGYVD
jgi:hypothetical protein